LTPMAILQDSSLCIECQACRVACQMQNQLPTNAVYAKMSFRDSGAFPEVTHHVVRKTCMHCADAACVAICPTRAVTKGPNGLINYQPARCSGCAYCAEVCPFGVPTVRGDLVDLCTGCPGLTATGQPPACVQTCPGDALSYGPREAILQRAERRVAALKTAWPEANVYSPASVGGTNLIWVLRERPEVYGLPLEPRAPAGIGALKNVLQPAGLVSVAAAAAITGLSFIIARRSSRKALDEPAHAGAPVDHGPASKEG